MIMRENYKWKWKGETNMDSELEKAREEIKELQWGLDRAQDEINVLQEEIDGFDSRLREAFDDGYQEAIDTTKDKLEEIE